MFPMLDFRGGGQAVQGGLSCPPPRYWNFFSAQTTCFKLSKYEFVSIIIKWQGDLSCFLCCYVSYAWLPWVGGKLSRAVYLAPHLDNGKLNYFILIPLVLIYLNYKVVIFYNHNSGQLSCFLCRHESYDWLQGWGASCPGRFILPPTSVLKVQ